MIRFFDTSYLLDLSNEELDELTKDDYLYLSTQTLRELENIKTNKNKDDDVKLKANRIAKFIDHHYDKFKVVSFADRDQCSTPDDIICSDALSSKVVFNDENLIFYSKDVCCRIIARESFKLRVNEEQDEKKNDYTGYVEVSLSDEEMAEFYSDLKIRRFDTLINQYLIVKDSNGNIVDKLIWNGTEYKNIKIENAKSTALGMVKAYNGDVYQQCALNSLFNNQITMLTGKAGSGKTTLALGVMMNLLERHKIDKIIVFCNPVATVNAARLGFYPGTRDEKLVDSQVGGILSSKLGGSFMLEQMLSQEKIILMPMSDIRGYDTSGMSAAIYITEAENMDITLMKLALQRIGNDCICIVDGDYKQQVDMAQYSGKNNGMRRLSEVFRGQPFYGEIELKNIYRSKIAEVADKM